MYLVYEVLFEKEVPIAAFRTAGKAHAYARRMALFQPDRRFNIAEPPPAPVRGWRRQT